MSLDLSSLLDDAIEKIGSPGVLVAISVNDKIKTFSAGSVQEVDHHRPFYIYSITKTFTAAAILQLCENRGDFLNKSLRRFLPSAAIPRDITIRHLLNHTGGVSDYFSSPEYHEALATHPSQPWSREKLMKIGLKGTPLFPPGEGWSYSNPGYALLNQLIEFFSGKTHYHFIQERILDVIGLQETRAFLAPDFNKELLEGEAPEWNEDFRPIYRPEWILPGCFISTVADVARFYDALFARKILSERSLREMTTTVDVLKNPPASSIPAYGLGVMHSRLDPLGDAYGHGGGGPGYTTYVRHYPSLNGTPFTVSLVLNKTLPQTPFELADDIVRCFMESV